MIGGDPNGVPFHAFAFVEWRDKYGVKPPWGKVEYMKLAAALKRFDEPEQARAAWLAFLADPDPYYQGHAPGLFIATLSKWTVKGIPKPAPRPEKFPGSERAAKMVAILREVEADATIPATMKRDEMARRWKGIEC